jgi:hypothetical protein
MAVHMTNADVRRSVLPTVALEGTAVLNRVKSGAIVLAHLAAMGAVWAWAMRISNVSIFLWLVGFCAAAVMVYLGARAILARRRAHGGLRFSPVNRLAAAAWLLVPALILATIPVAARGWDFDVCGSVLGGRTRSAAEPGAFATSCNQAFASRYIILAILAGAALLLIVGYAGLMLRRDQNERAAHSNVANSGGSVEE